MGVFRQFPYSNFHEMNMDEIIKIVKNMLEEWAQYHAQWDEWQGDINQAWQDMQDFINNYFDNLDVQEEINNKIISMVQTGEFADIVQPYIPPEVTSWLAEHITQPVGVVIDTSLSVAGACADAKATGDAINDVQNDLDVKTLSRTLTMDMLRPLEDKSISDDGTVGNSPTAWASTAFIPMKKGSKIVVGTGYQIRYGIYTTPSISDFVSVALFTSAEQIMTSDCYIRIACRKVGPAKPTREELPSAFTIIIDGAANILGQVDISDTIKLLDGCFCSDTGVIGASGRMATTDLIPVNQDTFYTFEFVYDDTNDGTSATNRIIGCDKNGDFVELIQKFASGGDGNVTTTCTTFFINNASIKYVRLSFAFLNITSYSLKAWGGLIPLTANLLQNEIKETQTISKESHYFQKSNPAFVEQIISVAESYQNQKNPDDTYIMHYGNRTPLQDNYDDDNSIDCSTFIGFVLRGIPFSESPYGGAASPDYDDDHGDGTDNSSGESGNYNYKQWTANEDYAWSIDPSNYNLTLDYNLTDLINPTISDPMYLVVRRAGQLAEFFANQGREIPLDGELANINPGDLVFWARKKPNGAWLQPYRYRHINHVALIISKEKAPVDATWDTDIHPWKHTYIEVGSNGAGNDVLDTKVLELEGPDTTNNVTTLCCAMRPDLGVITAIQEQSAADGTIGEMRYDSDYLYICTANGWKKVALANA